MQKISTNIKRHYLKIVTVTGLLYLILSFTDRQVFIKFPETFSMANRTIDTNHYDIEKMIDGSIVTSDDNPILVDHIKKQLNPPASSGVSLNLAKPVHKGQVDITKHFMILKSFNLRLAK